MRLERLTIPIQSGTFGEAMDNNDIYINGKYIVAVCAFCGRWRDSLDDWNEPPEIVSPMVEMEIIQLSHTYCQPCLREHSDHLGGHIAISIADRLDAKCDALVGTPYDVNDIVHNLMQANEGMIIS